MTKEINTGGPAFPTEVWDEQGCPQHTEGMSLRDWFAGKAIQGMFADAEVLQIMAKGKRPAFEEVAYMAYQAADAMLKERETT